MQICNECGTPKELNKYTSDKHKLTGRKGKCKECTNKRARARKAAIRAGKRGERLRPEPPKIPDNKIICNRTRRPLLKTQCIPGCNDACLTCESRQEGNVPAINTTTPEEVES
ncbi:hypothetical protein KAR91_21575 [Candidatus Pacearchaeota archaeon]|nr:hypothetical protein [Candidatus Pacearchaeota archaeon]